MDNVKLIALTGKARCGKDTAAQSIRKHMIDYNDMVAFQNSIVLGLESFAAPLKSMVAMLLDFFGIGNIMNPQELQPYLDGDKKEKVIKTIGASPRHMLQTLGTDWGRDCVNKDLWLNCMTNRIKHYEDVTNLGYKHAIVVITDCRFDNEAQLVKELGGTVVQVLRDDVPETVGNDPHASEAGVSPHLIDLTVENNGTFEEFHEALITALGDLMPTIPEQHEDVDDATVEM